MSRITVKYPAFPIIFIHSRSLFLAQDGVGNLAQIEHFHVLPYANDMCNQDQAKRYLHVSGRYNIVAVSFYSFAIFVRKILSSSQLAFMSFATNQSNYDKKYDSLDHN